MRSMTGFGRGEGIVPNGKITFRTEISSVNRKQFELKLTLPREMIAAEMEIRRLVASRVSRGSLSMRVEIVRGDAAESVLTVSKSNALSLLAQLKAIAAEAGLKEEPRIEALLTIPGLLEQQNLDFEAPEILNALLESCSNALDNLIRMRETEGENLRKGFEAQIELLAETIDRIEPLAADIPRLQKEKLLKRLQDNQLPFDCDDDRVLRELVIFSDRSDVTEEITRLRSHFSHFRSFLNNREEALGRNMDFLTQEIFRELNTLGNKAPTTEISPLIVRLKTEVEKIREQVQNIE